MCRLVYLPGVVCLLVLCSSNTFADVHTVRTTATTDEVDEPVLPGAWAQKLTLDPDLTPAHDLGYALHDVPGVWVRRQGQMGQTAVAQIRGLGPRQLVVSLDGFRLSTPYGPGFDLGTYGLTGIDTATVYRGHAALLHGSGSLSGAIDLSSTLALTPHRRLVARTFAGSYGTLGASVDTSVASGRSGLRISVGHRQSDGNFIFITPDNRLEERRNHDAEQLGALVSAGGRADRWRIASTGKWDRGERGAAGPIGFQDVWESARIEEGTNTGSVRAFRPGTPDAALSTDLRLQIGLQQRSFTFTDDGPWTPGGPYESRSNYQQFGASTATASHFLDQYAAYLRADYRYESYDATETAAEPISVRRDTFALTAALNMKNDRFEVAPAVRTEISMEDATTMAVLPSLGAAYELHQDWTVKAQGSRSHRVADFDERYLRAGWIRGNPDLQDESSWNLDAGVRFAPTFAAIELVGFYHHIDQKILFLPVNSWLLEARNLDGARSLGTEAAMHVTPTPRVRLGGAYTFTRAWIADQRQTQLPHQPEHQARAYVLFELDGLGPVPAFPAWTVRIDGNARSQILLDSFGQWSNPASLTADINTSLLPLRWLRAGLHVYNLFDERTALDAMQRPLPGRTLYVSLALEHQARP